VIEVGKRDVRYVYASARLTLWEVVVVRRHRGKPHVFFCRCLRFFFFFFFGSWSS